MYISHIRIKNFRALADIESDLSPRINVIVGPNAVGKTTILQAIRVAKAITAARTQQEAQNVLVSLGAASPHFPQRLFLNNLARDLTQPVEIRCTYTLADSEIDTLRTIIPQLVQSIVAARAGINFANPATLVQFLQSPQGVAAMTQVTHEVDAGLTKLQQDKTVLLGITISAVAGQIQMSNLLGGPFVAILDQRLPPFSTMFSYFPADRALPIGEVNLQLGGPDAAQQLESHNSQPQNKYARLKNLIINSLVVGESEKQNLHSEFENIFAGLLKGRRIKTININELGLLSVLTEEISTGRLVELDSLSSGEKNIALTFLIIGRSVASGGIALFDEPELHLNPSVSRDILPFMMEEYSKPRDIQFVMCTHSPEILSGAFASDDCVLLHLKSASDITRVGKRALDEYADALHRLGTSVSESLLYDGTVLVEGDDDVHLLESGFPEVLKKYKVKDRGGRREVEKTVAELQELEKSGQKVAPIYVIFDRDEEPTTLKSSSAVRILQWPRRSIENYLLDVDVIAELLKDSAVTKAPIQSEGEVHKLIRELAFKQLDLIAARDTYKSYNYQDASLTRDEIKVEGLPQLAEACYERMAKARVSLPNADKGQWIDEFQKAINDRKGTLQLTWEAKWRELCDGKKLISDLHKATNLRMSESTFKARITQRMRETTSETWRLVKGILEDLIRPVP